VIVQQPVVGHEPPVQVVWLTTLRLHESRVEASMTTQAVTQASRPMPVCVHGTRSQAPSVAVVPGSVSHLQQTRGRQSQPAPVSTQSKSGAQSASPSASPQLGPVKSEHAVPPAWAARGATSAVSARASATMQSRVRCAILISRVRAAVPWHAAGDPTGGYRG
jgi:hypothetical protein